LSFDPDEIFDCHVNWSTNSPAVSEAVARLHPGQNRRIELCLSDDICRAGVRTAAIIGLEQHHSSEYPSRSASTPMGWDDFGTIRSVLGDCRCFFIAGINPYSHDPKSLELIRHSVLSGECAGLKVFLGYYPQELLSLDYRPYFELANELCIPVFVHTGHLYEDGPVTELSRPMRVLETSIEYPQARWVACHMGTPLWRELIYCIDASSSFYSDTAGLSEVGTDFTDYQWLKERFEAPQYYERIVFGSDWPFFSVECEIAAVRSLFPAEAHTHVLSQTARNLFGVEEII